MMVRFADDFVCCFQYREDADKFYRSLVKRLAKFDLEIAQEKSKIIQFGRFAETNCKKKGRNKPNTFDFLGFTHYCSKSRNGKFRVKRKTSKKKFRAKVKAFSDWVKSVRNRNLGYIWKMVSLKLIGHFRYYGITDNSKMLQKYKQEVIKLLFKWLNRRSQRKSFTYEKFNRLLKYNPLPSPKIYVNIYGQD